MKDTAPSEAFSNPGGLEKGSRGSVKTPAPLSPFPRPQACLPVLAAGFWPQQLFHPPGPVLFWSQHVGCEVS